MKHRNRFLTLAALAVCSLVNLVEADTLEAWGADPHAWGNGTGSGTTRSTPGVVPSLSSDVSAVALGGGHLLAVQSGAIYSWDDNTSGQLGRGTFGGVTTTPALISSMASGVTAVSAGQDYSLGLKTGAVYAWGSGIEGQLGRGTTTNGSSPVVITALSSGVTAIAAGPYNALAIKNNAAFAWGENTTGSIGNGSFSPVYQTTPVAISSLSTGVTAVGVGKDDCLAIKNGAVYSWGSNYSGELGIGSTNISSNPTPAIIPALSAGVSAIAAGGVFNLAIMNGEVYAWGDNTYGQLGDGSTTDQLSPELIDPSDLTGIIQISASGESSYALSSDGSLWVWGENNYGELGVGTTLSKYSTPQHLLPPTGYKFTTAAGSWDDQFAAATIVAIVPEPSILSLLAFGSASLQIRRVRRST